MQITLDHQEIEKAIIEYVEHQGITLTGQNTEVTMIAGRGTNGYSANVRINPQQANGDTPPVTDTVQPKDTTPSIEFTEEDDKDEDDVNMPEETDTLFGN